MSTDEPDRVRAATADEINRQIDRDIDACLAFYARRPAHEIDGRIEELEREWDIERWLEANAAVLALTGVALGVLRRRAWLGLPVVVAGFLLQHAVQGWCPPVPLFRRWGVRTRREIDRELYGLRALRGDFAGLRGAHAPEGAANVPAAEGPGFSSASTPAAATALSGPA